MIAPATPEDREFLEEMFVQAVLWCDDSPLVPLSELLATPELGRYFREWGRAGDLALIAREENGPCVGAAWFRLFSADEPGYGYVQHDIPELGIAVTAPQRGRGVGRALLERLQQAARECGFAGLSLSVHPENPAMRLYKSTGFQHVGSNGSAATMLWSASG